MTNFFPDDVKEAASKVGGDYLKGSDFEGDGLTLQVVKPLEKIKANNPEYGAQEDDWMVEHGLLAEGETFRFHFKTADGVEKKLDSKSAPFFLGFKSCEELGVGDWIHVTRTGKTNKTRYAVVKVEEPDAKSSAAKPEEDLSGDIPF